MFVKEKISGTEPIRRLTIGMVPKTPLRGSFETSLFDYRIFNLKRFEVLRGIVLPILGATMETTTHYITIR